MLYLSLVAGIQGQDIGDVKFNQDGDAMGRYSVYQYQQVENTHDPKGEKRFVRRARYVRDAHTDRVNVQKPKSIHKSREFSSLLFTVLKFIFLQTHTTFYGFCKGERT